MNSETFEPKSIFRKPDL